MTDRALTRLLRNHLNFSSQLLFHELITGFWQRINTLVVQSLVVVDITVTHTIVLQHLNDDTRALRTWRRSFQFMIELGDLVVALARQGWSIDILSAERPGVEFTVGTSLTQIEDVAARAYSATAAEAVAVEAELAGVGHVFMSSTVGKLAETARLCACADVPPKAMAYPDLPNRLERWSYSMPNQTGLPACAKVDR